MLLGFSGKMSFVPGDGLAPFVQETCVSTCQHCLLLCSGSVHLEAFGIATACVRNGEHHHFVPLDPGWATPKSMKMPLEGPTG